MSEDNGESILADLLSNGYEEKMASDKTRVSLSATPEGPPSQAPNEKGETHTQWALAGNGRFVPVGPTEHNLPPGIYEPFATPGMWGLERLNVATDGIYFLPDMATETVINEVKTFWGSEQKYRDHNLLYKRGIILWGQPGSGKTITIKILMNEMVKQGGIVILAPNINLTVLCLKAVRRIEPRRNLIVVLEDIDEIINHNGEANVLSMLDGESNIDNVLNLATTNYPERLGARIVNRPSRFDRRVFVGMPSAEARRDYLDKATKSGLNNETLDLWTKDTKDMSIAHLRELVAAVYCLQQPYAEVLKRLIDMGEAVKAEDGFRAKTLGFKGKRLELSE